MGRGCISNYRPHAWLDNTRLYITQPQGNLLTSPQHLSLLDISQGNTQFVPIASANALCGVFEKGTDGSQLFTSSCIPVTKMAVKGLPATGGVLILFGVVIS